MFRSSKALTFGYGCTVHVGVDVGAEDIEVDVIYITFFTSAQYTGYLVLYKDKVQVDNWATEVTCTDTGTKFTHGSIKSILLESNKHISRSTPSYM